MNPIPSQTLKDIFVDLSSEIYKVCSTLFRIMIPMMFLVKVLEEFDLIPVINECLSPLMHLVGLPESLAIIWTTTLITNLYTGLVIFFQTVPSGSLSVAEVSILGGMMLVGHSILVEVPIMQKSGVRLMVALLTRIGGALLFGVFLRYWYEFTGGHTEPATWAWENTSQDNSWSHWLWQLTQSLVVITLVIAVLISMIRVLRYLKVEQFMIRLLKPILKLLGIAHNAASMTIIGMLLGLSFGGGLLIREAQAGHIKVKDIFSCIVLLGLCHSLIEDTILILLMGADITSALWLRLAFSFVIVAILTRVLPKINDSIQNRYLLHDASTKT